MHLSTWNLDYMFLKGISHTSVENPTYEFQKRNISSIQDIITVVPFRTTKDCHSCRSLSLVWQICSLNWDLDMDSFMGLYCNSCDGPVARYLLVMQGAWVQIQGVMLINFSGWHHWEPRFKSGFYNSFWDCVVPDRIPWMTFGII
jgi:hypothetical protein